MTDVTAALNGGSRCPHGLPLDLRVHPVAFPMVSIESAGHQSRGFILCSVSLIQLSSLFACLLRMKRSCLVADSAQQSLGLLPARQMLQRRCVQFNVVLFKNFGCVPCVISLLIAQQVAARLEAQAPTIPCLPCGVSDQRAPSWCFSA